MIEWPDREKQVVFETDLEHNYLLLREVLMQLLKFGEIVPQYHFEAWLFRYIINKHDVVWFQTFCNGEVCSFELPLDYPLKAAFLLVSLKQNFHTELHHKRGGKGLMRVTLPILYVFHILCISMCRFIFTFDSYIIYIYKYMYINSQFRNGPMVKLWSSRKWFLIWSVCSARLRTQGFFDVL